MNTALLIAAWLLPLLLIPLAWRTVGRWALVAAALPALAASALVPVDANTELDWLLLGVHLALDETGRMFLFFSAVLWLGAALYSAFALDSELRSARFRLFFLLALAGNLLLILAADMLTFYAGFTLMGLSAYGLVLQRRSQHARRAGRVYLVWTLLGEVALFAAVAMIAAVNGSARFDAISAHAIPAAAVALLVFGFGIKLALPGLHFWLPAAYSSAPAVVAAVMSGPMFNAGLLGWMRFLQPGSPGLSAWAMPLLFLGACGVLLGTVAGVLQRDPRAVLGYSSILKTGVVTSAFGSALAWPGAAPGILAAVSLYAMHHLLVKGVLFIGMAEWERTGPSRSVLAGLGLLALALAGAPMTGGAEAKSMLVNAIDALSAWPGMLLMFSAVGTVLLMGRFFWLLTRKTVVAGDRGGIAVLLLWLAWIPAALWLPFDPLAIAFKPADAVLLATTLALVWIAWSLHRGRGPGRRRSTGLRASLTRRVQHVCRRALPVFPRGLMSFRFRIPASGDAVMPLSRAGLLWLVLLLLLLILLAAN